MIHHPVTTTSESPIGVFDSGVGGLTVVAALQKLLPHENIFYIGDTARVPYGGKSKKTIERYSGEISELLLAQGAKMIVVACNTSSALALAYLCKQFSVPILGVIQPGAVAAISASHTKKIGVIGTKATVASKAYEKAIRAICKDTQVFSRACPLLVPLIEEEMFEDEVTNLMLQRYLKPLLEKDIDTLVLGCTHYPLLRQSIARVAGAKVALVDSAENCALTVQEVLSKNNSMNTGAKPGKLRVGLTDGTDGFFHVAQKLLGLEIDHIITFHEL
jgi:glutamate racemase